MSTDEFALYDAAYVLGALSPAERREFEDHLKGCAACASSVGELAGLPGLMSKVSVEELTAEIEAPPETLLPSLARAVRRERGRRRLAVGTAAAAAACLIAVGAVALGGQDSTARPPLAASASGSSTASTPSTASGTANLAFSAVVPSPVTASARLVDMAWGTRIELTCSYRAKDSYPAGGSPYALVVIDRSGAAQQVATWRALPDRELTVLGASSLVRQDIAAVEIRTLSGRAILRLST
jgi:anti-sigma factor RsiW